MRCCGNGWGSKREIKQNRARRSEESLCLLEHLIHYVETSLSDPYERILQLLQKEHSLIGLKEWLLLKREAARGERRGERNGERRGVVRTCQKFHLSFQEVVSYIEENFLVSAQEAEEIVKKYWG